MSGEQRDTVSTGALLAFYLPVLILGVLVVFPTAVHAIAINVEAARAFESLSYPELVAFGFVSFLPAILGHGLTLRFDTTRFFIGVGFTALYTLILIQQTLLAPHEQFAFSDDALPQLALAFLVQSAVWLGVALALGNAGLALRRGMLVSRAWRIGVALAGAALVSLVTYAAVDNYSRTGPLDVAQAIAGNANYRIVTGRGEVLAANSDARGLTRLVILRLPSGRDVSLIDTPVVTDRVMGAFQPAPVGATVRFRGRFWSDPKMIRVHRSRLEANGLRLDADHVIVIRDLVDDRIDGYIELVD